jgi:hypothetical protein
MEPKLDLDSITLGINDDDHMGGYEFTISANDTITLNNNTVINGGYTSLGYGAVPNVSITSPNATPYTYNPWTSTSSGKIKLDGKDADIEINGISLLKTMQEIQSRLNILQPNTALEAEWNELFELGCKYRKLEQQIKDKQATWDKLKAMPPPEID